jgi:TniQ protein
MTLPARWPLYPRPRPIEALTSWVSRVATANRTTVEDLLRYDLAPAAGLLDVPAPADLDWDPPAPILESLAGRTGVPVGELRPMTIAGWVPWLLDGLDVAGQDLYDAYVDQHSVLLHQGQRRPRRLRAVRGGRPWRPWLAPRPDRRPSPRLCPLCSAEGTRFIDLLATLPIMTSCVHHGVRLVPELGVMVAHIDGVQTPAEPVDAAVVALDRYTYQGLTTGRVGLPGRDVHVGRWFRLLRTLLAEVSEAPSHVGARSAATLRLIWQTVGQPQRAGLGVWQPYEYLDWPRQQTMLHAAAVAVQLAAAGEIVARGTLGPLLVPERDQVVYAGDEPTRVAVLWREVQRTLDEMIERAHHEPEIAEQLLTLFTLACRTAEAYERERDYVIGLGIPAEFLPTAAASGRADLAARS